MYNKCLAKTNATSNAPQAAAPAAALLKFLVKNQIHNYKISIIGTFIENHLQTNQCLLK
jgi:hypothetical protein